MKTVLITGGSRGIGASAAQECARRGMRVIVTYKDNPDAARAVVDAIVAQGGLATSLKLDVSEVSSFAAFRLALEAKLAAWGAERLDYLVNNAGFGAFALIPEVTEAAFDALFSVHLKGPFFLTQTLLPTIADGGQVVNLSSATVRVATAGVAPYAAFKSGIEALTRYMAKEFAGRHIRVNAIAPGAIRTELAGGINEEFEAILSAQVAMGRIGEAEDIGKAIASILSDDWRYLNGQTVEVAGGYIL